jgi:hypothetical protein
MTVGLAIEPLDALFAEQGSLDTLRHRACAHEPILGIEDLRSCGTSHADRLLKEDAGLEQVALKIAACVRNELIWVAQQGKREPPRVCRRLIFVSYAAMSSVSRAA